MKGTKLANTVMIRPDADTFFFLVYSDRPWLEHDGLIGVYDPRGLLRGLPGPAFLLFTIITELCFGEELGLQSPLSDTSPVSPWHERREVFRACCRDFVRISGGGRCFLVFNYFFLAGGLQRLLPSY